MKNTWKNHEADEFVKKHGSVSGKDIALLAYATRLVGRVSDLAMHGGGNTSCKGIFQTSSRGEAHALFIKPSGADMGKISPSDFIVLDIDYLKKLRFRPSMQEKAITMGIRRHMLQSSDFPPSIETPMHAFLEKKFVIHTHPSAILALSNRTDGEKITLEALGEDVGFIPYASLGFKLGRAAASEVERKSDPPAIVLSHHGLVTCGETAEEAYAKTIEIVTRAEEYLAKKAEAARFAKSKITVYTASQRYNKFAPLLQELLFLPADSPDNSNGEGALSHLVSEKLLALLEAPHAREIFCTAPLNPDHLLRMKIRPVFLENPDYDNPDFLRRRIAAEIKSYQKDYTAYLKRHSQQLQGFRPPDSEFLPRVLLLPGLGAICAAATIENADIFRDITRQAINVKWEIHETGGTYSGLAEDDAFEMELRIWQKPEATAKGVNDYTKI
jgi:rhamnose utilization protein RhaD (predicted bifunctional aldolase and dehydrogenase)